MAVIGILTNAELSELKHSLAMRITYLANQSAQMRPDHPAKENMVQKQLVAEELYMRVLSEESAAKE